MRGWRWRSQTRRGGRRKGHLDVRGLEPRQLLSGTVSFGTPVDYPVSGSPVALATGDFTNDGLTDLVIFSTNPGGPDTLSILIRKPGGGFDPPETISVPATSGALMVGDFNGDHADDIALADNASGAISIYLNNGSGGFPTSPSSVLQTDFVNLNTFVEGDFSGTGRLDIVAGGVDDDDLMLFQGNGDGTFQAGTRIPIAGSPYALAAGDFNNDGRTDLIAALLDGFSYSIDVLISNGDSSFSAQPPIPEPDLVYGLAVGPLDGSGNEDFAAASNAGIIYGFNNGNGSSFATHLIPLANLNLPPGYANAVVTLRPITIANVTGAAPFEDDILFEAGAYYISSPSSNYPLTPILGVASNDGSGTYSVVDTTELDGGSWDFVVGNFTGLSDGEVALTDEANGAIAVLPNLTMPATPRPTPTNPLFVGSAVKLRGTVGRPVRGVLADFREPDATARSFEALFDWGDGSQTTAGKIRLERKPRRRRTALFVTTGSHRYDRPGVFPVTVTIMDAAGVKLVVKSTVRVRR